MKASDFDLRSLLEFHPESGSLLLGQNRMLLFRQEALGTLRKLMLEQLGEQLTRALLTQFGYRCGSEDHRTLTRLYPPDSEMDELALGPVLHTWEGLVKAVPTEVRFDRKTGDFYMRGTWENSYEADIHLREIGVSEHAVCYSLTGYACGWGSAFARQPLLAIEPTCRGRGDAVCTFEAKPIGAWGAEADPWKQALAGTSYSLTRELEAKLATIERQDTAIRELSTPVIEVWDDVLALPIVGILDTRRSAEIMADLLDRVVATRAKCVIIDVTGIDVVDTGTADYLIKVVRAMGMLGSRCVVTGLRPSVAQTLVELGTDLNEIPTFQNLKAGLQDCIRHLDEGPRRDATPAARSGSRRTG